VLCGDYFGTRYLPKPTRSACPAASAGDGNGGAIATPRPPAGRPGELAGARQVVYSTVAHEIAHQWPGLVTMAWGRLAQRVVAEWMAIKTSERFTERSLSGERTP
jgi:hypothetical protein